MQWHLFPSAVTIAPDPTIKNNPELAFLKGDFGAVFFNFNSFYFIPVDADTNHVLVVVSDVLKWPQIYLYASSRWKYLFGIHMFSPVPASFIIERVNHP